MKPQAWKREKCKWFLSGNPVIDQSITGILTYSILLTIQPNIPSKAEKQHGEENNLYEYHKHG